MTFQLPLVFLSVALAAAVPACDKGLTYEAYPVSFLQGDRLAVQSTSPGIKGACMNLDPNPILNYPRSATVRGCPDTPWVAGVLYTEEGCVGDAEWFSNEEPLVDLRFNQLFKSISLRQCRESCVPLFPDHSNPRPPPPTEPPEECHIADDISGICMPVSECTGNGLPIAGTPNAAGEWPCSGGSDNQCCVEDWALASPECFIDGQRGFCRTLDQCAALGKVSHAGTEDEFGNWPCEGDNDIQCCM